MAALTPTNVISASSTVRGVSSELAGKYKVQVLTATLESASDTITLVRATDKITTILGVFVQPYEGFDAECATVMASFSGLVITLTSKNAAGAASSAWTDTKVRLLVIGY